MIIFHGRDEQVSKIVDLFLSNNEKNFVAIVGEQGVGKSSLIKAGFLPQKERFLPQLKQGFTPSEVTRSVALFTPKNNPLDQLTEALYDRTLTREEQNRLLEKYKNEDGEDDYEVTKYDLIEKVNHIGEFFENAGLDKNTNFFIVIDQFEELLRTYQRAIQDGNIDRSDECENFVDILLRSAEQPNIYIIITMRAEFIGECINFPGLIEAVNKGLFLVPKMTREQLKEAIIKPLKQFNGDIEDYLVQRILNDSVLETHPLPVIQHVLLRIWLYVASKRGAVAQLTYEDYEAVGGFDRAIDQHAEEIYAQLTEGQKKLCRGIFQCITERTISKSYVVNGRHPMRLASIAEILNAKEEELIEVIEFFNDYTCGFITPLRSEQNNITTDTIIDISHESLTSHWKRLQGWLDEEFHNAEMYKQLRNDARRWKHKKQNTLWRAGKLVDAVTWLERL
jgi:energy-coupling factor transporter ATP-binding protein EcfA2